MVPKAIAPPPVTLPAGPMLAAFKKSENGPTEFKVVASAKVVEETAVALIEQELNGIENLLYMDSASEQNLGTITLTFQAGTNLDLASVETQNRIKRAEPRLPEEALYHALMANPNALKDAGIKSVTRIGDCLAPGLIAYAVYAGHRYARELDTNDTNEVKFRRPLPIMATS